MYSGSIPFPASRFLLDDISSEINIFFSQSSTFGHRCYINSVPAGLSQFENIETMFQCFLDQFNFFSVCNLGVFKKKQKYFIIPYAYKGSLFYYEYVFHKYYYQYYTIYIYDLIKSNRLDILNYSFFKFSRSIYVLGSLISFPVLCFFTYYQLTPIFVEATEEYRYKSAIICKKALESYL